MPPLRGNVAGYDVGRMTFEFTMLTADAKIVGCGISSSAMDHLIGSKGALPQEREAQFSQLRDKVEQIVSDIFDQKAIYHIRIFTKDVDFPSRSKKPRGPG
jgi:hypothetical protein